MRPLTTDYSLRSFESGCFYRFSVIKAEDVVERIGRDMLFFGTATAQAYQWASRRIFLKIGH